MFGRVQYLRPDNPDPTYVKPATLIMSGRIRSAWVDQYNKKMLPSQRLIKDVRSMLMLKWIRNRFPGSRIIYIMRHPCAVAVSRIKLGWRIDLRKTYFEQSDLVSDYLAPFAAQILRSTSPIEVWITSWCIENYVPLAQLKRGDVHLVFYERLMTDPITELKRIFSFLDGKFDGSVLGRFEVPSVTSHRSNGRPVLEADPVSGWRAHVSGTEKTSCRRILNAFGLDAIYGESSLPEVASPDDLLGRIAPAV
jgi:hypothetical protein